ncbi:MAG: hypothetical protein ACYDBQ_00310 [Thermoplasmatota archaeon]
MQTWMKWGIGILVVGAIAGVGYAAARPGSAMAASNGHAPGPFAIFKLCKNDNMTIGQCKELVKERLQQRIDAAYQKCLQSHDQTLCSQRKAQAEARLARLESSGPLGNS